jgi:pyrroline-5-carboxylate reductase
MSGSLVLAGAGRMGGALLKGWLVRGLRPIIVIEPHPSAAIRGLARRKAITLVASPAQVGAKKVAACVVAIKPQLLKTDAGLLAPLAARGALMISIAAGTKVSAMAKAWGRDARIVRAMPNTPGAIGEGITGLYAGKTVTAADRRRAEALLSALGETAWVDREKLIDAVTAVSGSGPAYLFLMAEALTAAGIAGGLTPALAEKFARATVTGAGALLKADKSSARALREAVTSPGGTTAAALAVLMPELPGLVKRAAAAARKRAAELG